MKAILNLRRLHCTFSAGGPQPAGELIASANKRFFVKIVFRTRAQLIVKQALDSLQQLFVSQKRL
jgi:hypothetical protein